MKKKYIALLLCAVMATVTIGCSSTSNSLPNDNQDNVESSKVDTKKEPITISITMLGDMLIHNSVYSSAKTDSSYNFEPMFEDISYKTNKSDLTIANLEVPLAGKEIGYSNYPAFNCPEQLADACRDILGVDVFTTANNHSLDKGFKGLSNTLDFLDDKNISYTGTSRTQEEADKILIQNVKGVNVAILSYTYGTNGNIIPKNAPYCVNIIDEEKIKLDSQKAKDLGADVVIASIHWGIEYQRQQNSEQENLAKRLFENTEVDIIMGTHPHVVQPINQITVEKDGATKIGTVIYSLGNFVSGQNNDFTDTGCISTLEVTIDKENPMSNKVTSINYTPVYVDRNSGHSTKKFRVVDINKAILDYENNNDPLISKAEYNKLIRYRDAYRNQLIIDNTVSEN